MIKKLTAVYFSPTGNAEKIAKTIVNRMGKVFDNASLEYIDFTLPEHRLEIRQFAHDELVVFAVPVYAGRVPNKVLPFVQTFFKGNRTPVVPVVTFGNRSYDNALKELCMELDKNGFLVAGAAAVVGEHAFSSQLATGRPDAADMEEIMAFANQVANKFIVECTKPSDSTGVDQKKEHDICPIDRQHKFLDLDEISGDWPLEKYYTPLGIDGKPAVFLKAKPKTDLEICVSCGVCARSCPMGSIMEEEPHNVTGICIKCQACIKKCPNGAKYFDDEAFLSHVKMLEENYARKTESSLFL